MMVPIAEFKYFGILTFVILLCGLVFVLLRWPQSKQLTFSQHVAVHKIATIYYAVLFSVTLPLLLAFFIGWFQPTFQLSSWFNVLIALSSLAQLLATIVPETKGWKVKFHRFISGLSGVLLIPVLTLALLSNEIELLGKLIVLAGIIVVASIIGVLMINKKETFTPSFVHQSIYYASFFIPILVIGYLLLPY